MIITRQEINKILEAKGYESENYFCGCGCVWFKKNYWPIDVYKEEVQDENWHVEVKTVEHDTFESAIKASMSE